MGFESPKSKNEEKPKGRPRRPMVYVALAMMAIGVFGVLWSVKAHQTPPPPTTVITSYEVRSYTQQTTITTQNRTTTTTITTSQATTGLPVMPDALSDSLNALLKSLQQATQKMSSTQK